MYSCVLTVRPCVSVVLVHPRSSQHTKWLCHFLNNSRNSIWPSFSTSIACCKVSRFLRVSSSTCHASPHPIDITIDPTCCYRRWTLRTRRRPLGADRGRAGGLRGLHSIGLDCGERWALHLLLVGRRWLGLDGGSHDLCYFRSP